MVLPLEGLTVLELSASLGAAFCGKQLAELGARVVMLEPPTGCAARRIAPWVKGPDDPELALSHLYLNTAKESAVLDLQTDAGRRTLAGLVARADVVLHSLAPSAAAPLGLLPDDTASRHPRVIFAAVTPFGMDGPWADTPAAELTIAALSGYMSITGDPGREPLAPLAHQVEAAAGQVATLGILAALIGRQRDVLGDYVDVSLLEVSNATLDAPFLGGYTFLGRDRPRRGNLLGPLDVLRTRDGFVQVAAGAQHHWEGLMIATGLEEMAEDPRLATPHLRQQNSQLIMEYLRPWCESQSADEVFAAVQEMRLPSAIAETMERLLRDPQIAARGLLQEVDHALAGSLRYPARPFISDNVGFRLGRAPLLGEHQASIEEIRSRPTSPTPEPASPLPLGEGQGEGKRLPLEGLRVIDLTQVWAAPFATVILAELGADVIHVESPTRPDMTRFWTVNVDWEGPLLEKSAYYGQHNRGKRSLILNLAQEPAREVLKQLVTRSDVLINNFSARVMENWGFTYEEMVKVNPRIIYLTMPSFGATGPYRDYVSFGECLEGACGFTRGRGYDAENPRRSGSAMPDPYASFAAAMLILAGLRVRDAHGLPVSVDLSQRDASLRLIGEELLAYQVSGEEPRQYENAHREWAPHRAYRCAGEDRWVAIAARTDEEWQALCRVMHRHDLAQDAGLAAARGRLARRAEIDAAIEAWTCDREAKWVETMLLRAGVPAGVVQRASDLLEHPQLVAREFFPRVEHPFGGPVRLHATPVLLRRTPGCRTDRRAPLFDEHTEEVLSGVLGLNAGRIAELRALGVAGGEPPSEGIVVFSD